MKKKLLFAALAMSCAMSSFALEEGDYVYTKTGRVHVTGQNLFETGSTNLEGWTDATSSAVNNEVWAVEPGAGPEGEDVIQSQNAATENAALARLFSLDPGQYVISYQIKAAGETNSGTTTTGTTVGNNYMGIFLNTTGELNMAASTEEAPVVAVSSTENFTEDWKTVSYFITVEEGSFLVFHLEKMSVGMQVTNFSVNAAEEVYDIRIAQNKIAFAKQLLNDPNFNTPAAADARAYLNDEVIPTIEEMIAANGMDDSATAEDVLSGFEEAFSNYLDASSVRINSLLKGTETNDVINAGSVGRGNIEWFNKYFTGLRLGGGNWGHAPADAPYLMSAIQTGYATSATYTAYNTNLPAGKYFFTCEVRNAYTARDSWPCTLTYTLENVCKIFVGKDSVETEPISGEQFQRLYMIGNVAADGEVEVGIYWPGYTSGGAFQIQNVEVRAFDDDVLVKTEHIQAYKAYKTQWDAATNARKELNNMIGKKDYPWSQATLTEARDTWEPYYAAQDAKGWLTADGADAGIATTEDFNDWALYQGVELYSEPDEEGNTKRLEYQVVRGFQNAINAVKTANQPIKDLLNAINAAKSVRNNPKNASGDKAVIDKYIDAATEVYKDIYANTNDNRREADEARIAEQIAALQTGIDEFVETVVIKPIVDIDFSNDAIANDEGVYQIDGEAGFMTFTNWATNNDDGAGFTKGYQDVEELKDIIRIGNGTGEAAIDGVAENDAVEVTFDMWFGNLNKTNAFVELRNANNERVAGFSINRYNGSVAYNDFNNADNTGLDLLKYVSGIGASNASNGAICVANNKSTFTLKVDLAAGTIQGTVVNAKNGTCEGVALPIPEVADKVITKFVVGSNYGNKDRRCWFDNLKIFKFSGAAGIQGDVNGDNTVDVSDISAILTAMASGSSDPAADVNGDGTVDVADISATLTIMAGGTVE